MRRTIVGLQSKRMEKGHQLARRAMVELCPHKHTSIRALGNRYPFQCLQAWINRVLVLLSIRTVTFVASHTKRTCSDIEMIQAESLMGVHRCRLWRLFGPKRSAPSILFVLQLRPITFSFFESPEPSIEDSG